MSILIDTETTFIVQGITGREAVNLTRECLDDERRVRADQDAHREHRPFGSTPTVVEQ